MAYDKENRKNKRIQRNFVIRFRPESEDSWEMVTAEDISAGGLLILYDRELKVGSHIHLKINFPAAESPVQCVGKIVRVEEKRRFNVAQFYVAVIFEKIDEKDKDTIDEAANVFYSKEEKD